MMGPGPKERVHFFEAFEEEAAELGRLLPPGIEAGWTSGTIQESGLAAPPAPLISIRTQSTIPADWAGALDGVLSRSTGYEHLAAYRARHRPGLPCGYLPRYCARAVAEHALLLWGALARKLPLQLRRFATFSRDGLTGRELQGRTLLVVGAGNIGGEVARIGLGLGMEVLAVDPVRRHGFLAYVALEEGLAAADVIVCAMNLTESNRGLLDYSRLRRARPGALFVNIARGELSPPSQLLRLLEEGVLGGVALDVFDAEALLAVALRTGVACSDPEVQATLALGRRPDVVLTPHNAFNTAEALGRKAAQAVDQVVHFLGQGAFLWPVPEGP